jgi:hypothetical protein
MGHGVARATLAANAATLARLRAGLPDVLGAARVRAHELFEDAALEDGVFAVRGAAFDER